MWPGSMTNYWCCLPTFTRVYHLPAHSCGELWLCLTYAMPSTHLISAEAWSTSQTLTSVMTDVADTCRHASLSQPQTSRSHVYTITTFRNHSLGGVCVTEPNGPCQQAHRTDPVAREHLQGTPECPWEGYIHHSFAVPVNKWRGTTGRGQREESVM